MRKFKVDLFLITLIILLCYLLVGSMARNQTESKKKEESQIIEQVAQEYGLTGDAKKLLYVIRIVENGRKGRELGVLHPDAIDTDFRNQAQWAAGTIKKRYKGNLKEFANRWCPIGASNDPTNLNKNWYPNAKYWMDKLKGDV